MSAVMQQPGHEGKRGFAFDPISDATQVPETSGSTTLSLNLPSSQQPQQASSCSPTSESSPYGSPEEYNSPTSPTSTSPPPNPFNTMENSQLPRPVVLPPRAKPGRKPATDMPLSKRKAQNREAQRNFRDRKRQREHEVQEQVRQREHQHLEYIRRIQEQHEQEKQQMREQTLAAQEEEKQKIQSRLSEQTSALEMQQRRNEELNAQVQELIRRQSTDAGAEEIQPLAQQVSSKRKRPLHEPQSPKSSNSKRRLQTKSRGNIDAATARKPTLSSVDESLEEPMEVDFTNMGKPSQDNPSLFTPLDAPDDTCGFCTTNTYCACKDRMVNSGGPALTRGESYMKLSNIIEPSAAPVGPGGCQACLDDPERRRICLAMASSRQDATPVLNKRHELSEVNPPFSSATSTRQAIPYSVSGSASGWQESHMTCTDAITFGQQNDPNFHENWNRHDFIERLRVVKSREDHDADDNPSSKAHKRSPQDVEIASIMAAMSASGDAGAAASAQNEKRSFGAASSSRAHLFSLKEEHPDA